jgi:broad specificity phosphatase PhoE
LILYFIRHGDDDKHSLTDKGIKQSEMTGIHLRDKNAMKLFTSRTPRVVQTAAHMNRHLHLEIEICDELCEISMGDCVTLGWEYVEKHNPSFYFDFHKHDWDMRYPNGENGADVWKRVSPFIFNVTKSDCGTVIIVTHGGIIRVLVSGLLGMPQNKRFYLGYPLVNCSITTVMYDKLMNTYHLHSFNNYSHIIDLVDQP